jgi:DNA polymerase V
MNSSISFLSTPISDRFLTKKRDSRLIASGFPAASDDYADKGLNLHELLVKNTSATYFMKVVDMSFSKLHIYTNDLLVIDRSLTPKRNSLIIFSTEKELMLDRLALINGKLMPLSAFVPNETPSWMLWGVVTVVIHPTDSPILP